ncbi:MAG TPA: PHP domain-containing protein [Actinomycetota bacterium]|nr:PHP domain-containing protein [Actinomycetota bacterium]
MPLSNGQIAELLATAAEEQEGHRRRALGRAARAAAFYWPEEAAALHSQGRSLTELTSVGPWLARQIAAWFDDPPEVPDPPPLRRGFLTLAEVRTTLSQNPDWAPSLRADLQMHTTYSDGKAPLPEMVSEARTYGYEHVAITDHSKGLPIARGMDEARLAAQGFEIGRMNEDLESSGDGFRILRAIEMNISPEGEGDMDLEALRALDLVLGAFHSKLRVTEDQTDRYVAALRNPTLNVLAHPRGRRFGVRLGLQADWQRVFEAAVVEDKALEIDGFPDRQDLDVELLQLAREVGVRISIGTDAHSTAELRFMEYGLAAAIRAGIPRERILNYLPRDQLLAWARESRSA